MNVDGSVAVFNAVPTVHPSRNASDGRGPVVAGGSGTEGNHDVGRRGANDSSSPKELRRRGHRTATLNSIDEADNGPLHFDTMPRCLPCSKRSARRGKYRHRHRAQSRCDQDRRLRCRCLREGGWRWRRERVIARTSHNRSSSPPTSPHQQMEPTLATPGDRRAASKRHDWRGPRVAAQRFALDWCSSRDAAGGYSLNGVQAHVPGPRSIAWCSHACTMIVLPIGSALESRRRRFAERGRPHSRVKRTLKYQRAPGRWRRPSDLCLTRECALGIIMVDGQALGRRALEVSGGCVTACTTPGPGQYRRTILGNRPGARESVRRVIGIPGLIGSPRRSAPVRWEACVRGEAMRIGTVRRRADRDLSAATAPCTAARIR